MVYRVELWDELTNDREETKILTAFPSLKTALRFVEHLEAFWARKWEPTPCPWRWHIVGNIAGVDLVIFSPVLSYKESGDVA